MVKEIEKSILYVVHNMHFTANELALCNLMYNVSGPGLTLPEINERLGKDDPKSFSGITSMLAQKIDELEHPGEKFGFTGYLLFFERYNTDLHHIRPEFKKVIDQHKLLADAMKIPLPQVYTRYKDGLDLS